MCKLSWSLSGLLRCSDAECPEHGPDPGEDCGVYHQPMYNSQEKQTSLSELYITVIGSTTCLDFLFWLTF